MMSRHFALSSELTGTIAKRHTCQKLAFYDRQFPQSIRYINCLAQEADFWQVEIFLLWFK